jgi:hypothetical protein
MAGMRHLLHAIRNLFDLASGNGAVVSTSMMFGRDHRH